MNFIEELKWRGMIHDIMPDTEEQLKKRMTSGYIGFDPTAPSLTVGNLVPVMLLVHFQHAGHKPIALVGGATGLIGDPSGKSEERKLLPEEKLLHYQERIEKQLNKFLDFDCGENSAIIINNKQFYKQIDLFEFFRDIGKHLTVNYMTAKDSVKNRLEDGMSFAEFSYQLFQAYDFLWLFNNKNCIFQMGGSDQWGNITSGAELIRKKEGGKAIALTCPLLTKADGTKFGKTEEGNIWLDPQLTSPYKFYQFWLNCSDEDAAKFIRIFTTLPKKEIASLEKEHEENPHLRPLQKALAKDITIRVHSEEEYAFAVDASDILFGKGTEEALRNLPEKNLLSIFEGVPQSQISLKDLDNGIGIIDFLAEKTTVLPSKNEAHRMIKGGGISINKTKVNDESRMITTSDLLNNRYILVQKGKKNYCLVTVV
ncbi:MAG: tyrosine--tRNA ligase [Bacteroidota bacterium]